MTIRDLSKISRVSPETIRLYRNRGLLTPQQNKSNRYYNYSIENLYQLLYIRKLRKISLPLGAIADTYQNDSLPDLVTAYGNEAAALEQEILGLKRKKAMLDLTLDHLRECRAAMSEPVAIQSYGEKYDCIELDNLEDPALDAWMEHMDLFAQTLWIPKAILSARRLPEYIPLRAGIGSYKSILDEYCLPIPEHTIVYPHGSYITDTVVLKHLDSLRCSQILPLLRYIKKHNYTIDSDMTAFLFHIQQTDGQTSFSYRVRVKII